MDTKQMRSFAAGLIVAASVTGAAYLISGSGETVTEVEKPSVESMKKMLTEEGYLVYSEEEFQTQLAAAQEPEKQAEPAEQTETQTEKETTTPAPETEEPKTEVATQSVLNVTSGMTSYDVGKVLVSLKITDTAMGFSQEVEKRGVANKLRLGTYNINSNMTVDEVIAMVFK